MLIESTPGSLRNPAARSSTSVMGPGAVVRPWSAPSSMAPRATVHAGAISPASARARRSAASVAISYWSTWG